MSDSYDRRELLKRGIRTAAGGAILLGGGTLIGACGTPAGKSRTQPSGPGSQRPGGSLTFATEAEETGFNPATNVWDSTGLLYARTVYDPLFTLAPDGSVQPYLAASISPSASYTRWRIGLRPGIRFHDGSPLDAAAVKANLDAFAASPLTGPALSDVAGTTVLDSMTVEVATQGAWVPYPYYLTQQVGCMAAPSYLASTDREAAPVGTGPFVYSEWVPGSHFTATRNPRYWRAGLPYLDEITYRPIPDTVSREESLVAGTVDLMHSSNTQNVVDLMHRAGFTQVDDLHATSPPGQHCVMLNTAVAPTNDIRVRKALALATDAQRIIDVIYSGLTPPSNGPFAPGSPWYGPTGYPSYDPSGARALLRGYRADGGKASLTLGAVATSSALDTVELIQAMWEQVGIKVTLSSFEQATLIENAVLGRFQAYLWRDFEAADPDGIATSWRSADSRPPGSDALNFARNSDPLIDSALQRGRTSSTNGARAAAYQEVARRLAVDLPYVWLTRNVWIVAAGPGVMGLTDPALPGGGPALDMLAGVIWPSNLWRV